MHSINQVLASCKHAQTGEPMSHAGRRLGKRRCRTASARMVTVLQHAQQHWTYVPHVVTVVPGSSYHVPFVLYHKAPHKTR